MVDSILTNFGALVALQNLQMTQQNLLNTQNQISTGLKVSSAKDDAATWAISTQMQSNVSNLQQVSSNLSQTDSVVGTAVSATASIADLISQIRAKVTSAQAPGTDTTAVQNDINQLVAQIQSTVDSSNFNGVNLINNTSTNQFVSSVTTDSQGNSTPSYITVDGINLGTGAGGALNALSTLNVENRATQLFNVTGSTAAQTATQNAAATRALDYTIGTAASAGAVTATNFDVTTSYVDASGQTQTLTTAIAAPSTGVATAADNVSDIATALNNNAGFSALFHASADPNTASGLLISAANRSEETGSFAISGMTMAAASGTTGGITATAATSAVASTMTFQNGQYLVAGDTFGFNYKTGSTTGTVDVTVGNDANGTIESYDAATNTTTVSLSLSNLEQYQGTANYATQVATAMSAALTTWNDNNHTGASTTSPFASSASGTAAGVTATGASLTVYSSTNATDNVSVTSPTTDYAALLSTVDAATQTVTTAGASYGSTQSRIETQQTFVDSLVSSLQAGIGNMIDADMTTESARLTALQVQQQLGTQALSIANQAPQSILSLFK